MSKRHWNKREQEILEKEKEFLEKLKCWLIIKEGKFERFGCMNCERIYGEINKRLEELKNVD